MRGVGLKVETDTFGDESQHIEYPCRYDLITLARKCIDQYEGKGRSTENPDHTIKTAIRALQDLLEIEKDIPHRKGQRQIFLAPRSRDGRRVMQVMFREV